VIAPEEVHTGSLSVKQQTGMQESIPDSIESIGFEFLKDILDISVS
jgi:hypothetical protein